MFQDGLLEEKTGEMTNGNTSDNKKSKEQKIRDCLKVILYLFKDNSHDFKMKFWN